MKTLTSSVAFQDEAGNLLGSLILNLPSGVYSVVSGGGQVAGQSLIINLDATGKVPGAITIWASDELSPQTPYAVTLCAQANGVQAIGTTNWFIGGSSPIDLSQMVPTAAGVSYSGAVLTNPTSQQTINGQTLNMEGASVRLFRRRIHHSRFLFQPYSGWRHWRRYGDWERAGRPGAWLHQTGIR
jgi:hypothetical protein